MNRKKDLENLSKLYESFNEDEQSSAFGQELADKEEDQNPVQNYEDEEENFEVGDEVYVRSDLNDFRTGRISTPIKGVISHINGEEVQIDAENNTVHTTLDQIYSADDKFGYVNKEDEENIQEQQQMQQQQPVYHSNEEEYKKGDGVTFMLPGGEFKNGSVIHTQDGIAFVDIGVGIIPVPVEDLKKEEDAEDLGPNQEPESWGDEAMGEEQPGETSARFSQNTPDDPASGGGRSIDNPDEEENDDPYYNREEDLRSRGIDPDAEDPDADEKGKEERNHEDEEMTLQKALEVIKQHMNSKNKYGDDYDIEDETLNFGDREKAMKVYIKNLNKKIKKESYSSHGDRDMSLLAENYLNIKKS